MKELISLNLSDIEKDLGQPFLNSLLSSFSCPLDSDIQDFIHNKALSFSQQSIAKTHLVFLGENDFGFAGIFALTQKNMQIDASGQSKNICKKLNKYGKLNTETNIYDIPSILIAQLSKNYANGINNYIDGCDLLEVACEKIKSIQKDLGGKLVFLECKENDKLIDFYEANGFRRAQSDDNGPNTLIKMFKLL